MGIHRESTEILVGALLMGVLLLALFFAYDRGQNSEIASGYPVSATFNRVDGLAKGDPVRLSGINVGRVSGMSLDNNFRVQLILAIDDSVKLPTDTSAAIHTDGLFGSKFVILEPGGEERMIPPSGHISMTQDSVVIEELLELIIAEGKSRLEKQDNKSAQ